MTKTKQVLKVEHGSFRFHVIFHLDEAINPYWVYESTWEYEKGRYSKKLVEKYQDLVSVLYYLYLRCSERRWFKDQDTINRIESIE